MNTPFTVCESSGHSRAITGHSVRSFAMKGVSGGPPGEQFKRKAGGPLEFWLKRISGHKEVSYWYHHGGLGMAFARQEQKRREMTLRIPAELKERLERIAQANRRSLTREIEVALQKYADENEPIDSCASNVVS